MNTEFKKWLCKKAGDNGPAPLTDRCWELFNPSLEILIKAMWAINKEFKRYLIYMNESQIHVWDSDGDTRYSGEYFSFILFNWSEEKALEAALGYIWKKTR